MKYYDDVETFIRCYPGLRFRLHQVARAVAKANGRVRPDEAMRRQVREVMKAMCDGGVLEIQQSGTRGSFDVYIWHGGRAVAAP